MSLEGAKPESGKLIVLIAEADTQTPGNAIAKAVKAKDARTADAATLQKALNVIPENSAYLYYINNREMNLTSYYSFPILRDSCNCLQR